MFKLALFCGGPSLERGISLNSARSVLDHVARPGLEIQPFYVDPHGGFHKISPSQLYSNTPGDFDFKLAHTAEHLSEPQLIETLKTFDLVFPAIHGAFGEDGALQALLEQNNIPFVGSPAEACRKMFYKHIANQHLAEFGAPALPFQLITARGTVETIRQFFTAQKLTRAIVKPVAGGSSIGVTSVATPELAYQAAQILLKRAPEEEVLLEPFCEGKEFTVVVLQNADGKPVALLPSEIDVSYQNNQIFDFRRKYLPTNQVSYHCPPRFSDAMIQSIQEQAEMLFQKFGMRDFARLDGWLIEDAKNETNIRFSDFNPISGMEQNSFLFQQGARVGFSHADVLDFVISSACQRYNLKLPPRVALLAGRQTVNILFGGQTAERQVSLMSGTNIWLKLRSSERFAPHAFLLQDNQTVWALPYAYTLNHTVEEILDNCIAAPERGPYIEKLANNVRQKLQLSPLPYPLPKKMSLEEFCQQSKKDSAFVFLGLHGGIGEDGTIQSILDKHGIPYNGSNQKGSALCIDKYKTGEAIKALNDPLLITAPKRSVSIDDFRDFPKLAEAPDASAPKSFNHTEKKTEQRHDKWQEYWQNLVQEFKTNTIIIKPQSDGCSAGVICLTGADDLHRYVHLVQSGATHIPSFTFDNQPSPIEMGDQGNHQFLLEAFIRTDKILIQGTQLDYEKDTGWIELTVGVLENNGQYYALSPSITVAEGNVLSLEEKFQGGTGVNITPPPPEICTNEQIAIIKRAIEKSAQTLGIKNYARLDVFFNTESNVTLLIEANTLPGLTPSTVIYHQALAENPPLRPSEFLERIIDLKLGTANLKTKAIAA